MHRTPLRSKRTAREPPGTNHRKHLASFCLTHTYACVTVSLHERNVPTGELEAWNHAARPHGAEAASRAGTWASAPASAVAGGMDESSTAGHDVRGRLGAVRVAGSVARPGGAHPGAGLRPGAFRPDALREPTPSGTRTRSTGWTGNGAKLSACLWRAGDPTMPCGFC